jgi:hypothetical protein
MDLIQSSWTNALFLLLAVLAGWIVLRFLVRLTGKLLRLGCLAVALVAALALAAYVLA